MFLESGNPPPSVPQRDGSDEYGCLQALVRLIFVDVFFTYRQADKHIKFQDTNLCKLKMMEPNIFIVKLEDYTDN